MNKTDSIRLAPIPSDESARLQDLSSLDLLDTPHEAYFDGIVEIASALLDCPIATLSLVDKDRQWFKASIGMPVCQTRREISFCTHAIMSTETMVVEDALRDERFADSPLVLGEPGIRFYVGVPLRTYRGHQVGALCVIDTKPRTVGVRQLRLLERLASIAVEGMESRRIFTSSL